MPVLPSLTASNYPDAIDATKMTIFAHSQPVLVHRYAGSTLVKGRTELEPRTVIPEDMVVRTAGTEDTKKASDRTKDSDSCYFLCINEIWNTNADRMADLIEVQHQGYSMMYEVITVRDNIRHGGFYRAYAKLKRKEQI